MSRRSRITAGILSIVFPAVFRRPGEFRPKSERPAPPAWRRFNQNAKKSGSVGIWHETYRMDPGDFEAVCDNMPPFGLGKATERVPATGRRETARRRLGGQNDPAAPSE